MKIIFLKIMIYVLNFIYMFMKLFPTQDKVIFMSRQSNEVGLDFTLLSKELKQNHKVVIMCKTLDKNIKSILLYGIYMFKQMYHLATAKVCILDSYSPTVSILKHKKNLTIIQIWHSIGSMKKFGRAILDKTEGSNEKISEVMKQHQNYDIIFASSDAYKKDLAKGFGCDINKITTMTLPRIDLLKDKEYQSRIKQEIINKYPALANKKNIVYCPTFRKEEDELEKAVNSLVKNINHKKYNIIIKLHPLSKIKIENENAIIDKEFSTFEMLSIADKVISDYSCVIYEAGILNIPLYFYNFDIKKYEVSRGLAIDCKELPGFIFDKPNNVMNILEKEYDFEYLKKFIKKYVTNQDECTQKMVNKIEEYL